MGRSITDRAPEVSRRYGIPSIPFFGRFEHGEMVKTVVRPDYEGIPFLITSSNASMSTSTSRTVV